MQSYAATDATPTARSTPETRNLVQIERIAFDLHKISGLADIIRVGFELMQDGFELIQDGFGLIRVPATGVRQGVLVQARRSLAGMVLMMRSIGTPRSAARSHPRGCHSS